MATIASTCKERLLRLNTAVVACWRESVCLVIAARLCYIDSFAFGVWLSLVERLVRDQEVASSNLVTPTYQKTTELRDSVNLPSVRQRGVFFAAKTEIPFWLRFRRTAPFRNSTIAFPAIACINNWDRPSALKLGAIISPVSGNRRPVLGS
jgi:hypothetical protein